MKSAPDHGRRRLLRAGATGIATIVSRGIAVGVGLLTLPFASRYLGKERFGVWLTLSSFLTWVVVADLGLANSLINQLSHADGREDSQAARQFVASAFWMLVVVAIVLMMVSLPIALLIPWAGFFNLHSADAVSEVLPAILILLTWAGLRLPTSIVGPVFQALQEGYIFQIWSGLGGLLGAAGILAAIGLKAGLPGMLAGFLGGMLLSDWLGGVYLFFIRHRPLLPVPRFYDPLQAKRLLQLGGQFWIAQMSAILVLQTDLVIVTRLFGPGEAAAYGTMLRLFYLLGAVQMAFITPLWAAYGEARARGDIDWMERTFARSVRLSLIGSGAASLILFLIMPRLFGVLVTSDISSDPHLGLALMITEMINSAARAIAVFLNGIGAVRMQVIFGPIGGLVNLLLSISLGKLLGPPGVAWATGICLFVFSILVMGRTALIELRGLHLQTMEKR